MVDYGYDDIEKWINFLIDLKTRMPDLTDIREELVPDAITHTEKLTRAIDDIRSNPKNWIVSEIKNVFGASGNTGTIAVQLGKKMGAKVIAVSSRTAPPSKLTRGKVTQVSLREHDYP